VRRLDAALVCRDLSRPKTSASGRQAAHDKSGAKSPHSKESRLAYLCLALKGRPEAEGDVENQEVKKVVVVEKKTQ